ncbi:MAG: hypothetical protein JRN15_18015 [Nitrososphaerota archaeon]|nr:hypothetical protein [Nitrososphaerota archaeon]
MNREEARELIVFMIELREQCALCVTALSELEVLVKRPPPDDDEGRRLWNRRIWIRVHALLSASSNVTHILWPKPIGIKNDRLGKTSIQRGKRLRKFIGIQETNPLVVRKVRNSFEHIDERLDEWLPTTSEDIPLGWAVSAYDPENEPPEGKSAFRYINVNSMDLRISGETCNLDEVVRWVQSIDDLVPTQARMFFHGDRELRHNR